MKTSLADTKPSRYLRHGRVTCTLVSGKTGQHITLRLRARNRKRKGYVTLDQAAILTTDVPRARAEDGSYTNSGDRVGWMHPTKGWRPNKGSDPARYWALEQLWRYLTTGEVHPQIAEIKVESHCGRCGRPLNDPESVDRGLGPDCYGESTKSQHQSRTKKSTREQMELIT